MFCVGFMTEYPPETLAILCWKITTETFEWNSNDSVKIFIDTNRIWNMHGSLRQNVRGPSLKSSESLEREQHRNLEQKERWKSIVV